MPGRIVGDCQLCKANKAIYRCPRCSVVYCSLGCFKPHKETCVAPPSVPQNTTPEQVINKASIRLDENEKEEFVPQELLKKLGDSDHLKGLLNNQHLKDMLVEVDSAQNQAKVIEKAMQIPIFTEFVDECLKIVEPEESHSYLDLS